MEAGYGYITIYRHSHLSEIAGSQLWPVPGIYEMSKHTPDLDMTPQIDMHIRYWY